MKIKVLILALVAFLSVLQAEAMQIFVKTIDDGRHITLEVEPADLISSLKQKLTDKENIALSAQQLYFAGTMLADDATLEECGIQKDSTLHLVFTAATVDISEGTVTIAGESYTQNSATYSSPAGYILITSSATDNTVEISGGTEESPLAVTLRDMQIDRSALQTAGTSGMKIITGSHIDFTVEGESVLRGGSEGAGMNIQEEAYVTVTAQSTGVLSCYGGTPDYGIAGGAGIGANAYTSNGHLTINGGTVNGYGCNGGAGFGSAYELQPTTRNVGSLTVNGGVAVFVGYSGPNEGFSNYCTQGVGNINGPMPVAVNSPGILKATVRSTSQLTFNGAIWTPLTLEGMAGDKEYEIEQYGAAVAIESSTYGDLALWVPEDGDIHSVIGDKVMLNGFSDPKWQGTVDVAGFYDPGTQVPLSATYYSQYDLESWIIDDVEYPAEYTLTLGTEDKTVTARLAMVIERLWDYVVVSETEATAAVREFNAPSGLTELTVPSTCVIDGKTYTVISLGAYDGFCEIYSRDILKMVIPETIRQISPYAFGQIMWLEQVEIHATEPPALIKKDRFSSVVDDMTLYVPFGTSVAYRAADGWKDFGTIVELPSEEEIVDLADGMLTISSDGYTQGGDYVTPGKRIRVINTAPEGSNYITVEGGTVSEPVEFVIENVHVDNYNNKGYCGIRLSDSAHAVLVLSGENSLRGGTETPAIRVAGSSSLVIEAEEGATLEAIGGGNEGGGGGAGIGGGIYEANGDITINGGVIYAKGEKGGAGIGTGWTWGNDNTPCGTITVNGGFVIATEGTGGLEQYNGGHNVDAGVGSVQGSLRVVLNGGYLNSTSNSKTTVTDSEGHTLECLVLDGIEPHTYWKARQAGTETDVLSDAAGICRLWVLPGTTVDDATAPRTLVSVKVSDWPEFAECIGGGIYDPGTTLCIAVAPDENWNFGMWSDGVGNNPRTVEVGEEHSEYIATLNYCRLLNLTVNETEQGYIAGGNPSGAYEYGTRLTVETRPLESIYVFSSWSDGNTSRSREITLTTDMDITPEFRSVFNVNPLDEEAGTCYIVSIEALHYSYDDFENVPSEWSIPSTFEIDGKEYTLTSIGCRNDEDEWLYTMIDGVMVTSLTIPSTVVFVTPGLFYDLEDLSEVTCLAECPPALAGSAEGFRADVSGKTLSVLKTSVQDYMEAPGWKDFGTFNITTGIGQIAVGNGPDMGAPAVIYNLQGIELRTSGNLGEAYAGLTSGFYIVRQGDRTFKIKK